MFSVELEQEFWWLDGLAVALHCHKTQWASPF